MVDNGITQPGDITSNYQSCFPEEGTQVSSIDIEEYSGKMAVSKCLSMAKNQKLFSQRRKSRTGLQIKVQTEIMRDLDGEDNLRNLTFRILNFFTFKLLCKHLKFVFILSMLLPVIIHFCFCFGYFFIKIYPVSYVIKKE